MADEIPEFGAGKPGAEYILRPGGYVIARNSQGEIAVVQTPKGFFLPGGGQNSDESAAQAALREAHEECCLLIRLTGLLGTADELVFARAEGRYYRKRSTF